MFFVRFDAQKVIDSLSIYQICFLFNLSNLQF